MSLNLTGLTAEEFAVVEWQYGMCGDFKASLWQAISRADSGNMARLRRGFPVEVEGYRLYTQESGWWQRVQKMVLPTEPSSEVDTTPYPQRR